MAKPNWLNVSPSEGSGNGSISNSAMAHTGRVQRTGTVTVTGTGVSTPATYTVVQSPKSEFASFTNGATMSAPKGGGTVTVAGTTNSSKLTFAFVGDSHGVSIPTVYQANGAQTTNGASVTGDPGAVSEFPFSIALVLPENETISDVTFTLKVTCNGAQTAQIAIVQAAGDATLSVSPTEITLNQAGDAVSVAVTSNTTWSVS